MAAPRRCASASGPTLRPGRATCWSRSKAASINPIDWKMREGMLRAAFALPNALYPRPRHVRRRRRSGAEVTGHQAGRRSLRRRRCAARRDACRTCRHHQALVAKKPRKSRPSRGGGAAAGGGDGARRARGDRGACAGRAHPHPWRRGRRRRIGRADRQGARRLGRRHLQRPEPGLRQKPRRRSGDRLQAREDFAALAAISMWSTTPWAARCIAARARC